MRMHCFKLRWELDQRQQQNFAVFRLEDTSFELSIAGQLPRT